MWTEGLIRILLYDSRVFQTTNTGRLLCHDLQYVPRNLAMGGTLGGRFPGSSSKTRMEIDDMRIDQWEGVPLPPPRRAFADHPWQESMNTAREDPCASRKHR